MYAYTIDEANAVLLGISTAPREPQDLERFLESVRRVDQVAWSLHIGALIVNFPDSDFPSPSSLDRKRIAERKSTLRAHPSLFILVTGSALWRSVITAISWLSPQNETISVEACGTFAQTVARAGAYRPGCELPLWRMERALRSERATEVALPPQDGFASRATTTRLGANEPTRPRSVRSGNAAR